ncbi:hypothetical protein HYH03_005560 [Edaphochlamys debaryana]|uniref:Peptidyl-prolyl cis-trans isomerase n=1 Tax=Edaphochlamys debaryana TaxID=47281 RepID=A0A836C136_9CHLO|nr:hypothetical protein HYH03_005560 [Edaphochlamys debaryana]|eukprot:KAG2496330.1 hypothetical protein HYH03_005560 [Edaphochlamys debaryana]
MLPAKSLCRPLCRLRQRPFPASTGAAARGVAAKAGPDRVVRVAHILLNEDAPALANEIEGKLKAGAPFEELARTHSSCGSSKRGGELGWLSRGTFFPQFELAAFATPVGGITRATTGRGLHVIKVLEEKFQASVSQLPAESLLELLGSPALLEDMQLVDVREEWEFQTARLPGFKLMPLSSFNEWAPQVGQLLDPSKETVVLCHHGVRSMQMSQFLVQNGFQDVKNVTGGIDAYSRVDPSVPIY